MSENAAKRVIKKGSNFEKYFKPFCNSTFLGYGNTDLSIKIMAKWVKKYKYQTKQLALDNFSGKSLLDTVNDVYQFAHDHFQYKLDGTNQQIRSPYCAWLDRYNGIDCKSYSVIVGTILDNLGINFYFKKTKQPGFSPDQFTHVYIAIPKNQKTNSLEDYYIIDATIHNNIELPYLEANTKFMSSTGLKHYGLGRPNFKALGMPNMAASFENPYFSNNQNLGFNPQPNTVYLGSPQANQTQDILDSVLNIFNGIDCLGGTAYDNGTAQADRNLIKDFFAQKIQKVKQAVSSNNMRQLADAVTDFYGTSKALQWAHAQKLSEGWNSCTTKNLENTRNLVKFYETDVKRAMNEYLKAYYNLSVTGEVTYSNENLGMFWGGYTLPYIYFKEPTYNISLKPGITQVKEFQVTQYVADANGQGFNTNQFLQTLGNIALDFVNTGGSTGSNTGGNTGGYTGGNTDQNFQEPEQQKAGFTATQGLLLAGLVYGAYKVSQKSKK